ncbi:innexin inx2 [Eurytemora carolleeae]|uniref:innexin inx2 n=1 Tax=Eurytemora carolleeae TaxID=1294199 RepID=UPI000C783BAB|nr:innexin inx2 [Eurytemora carolleeae]|eukprot:XP_023332426.1 innexin inx2-like [Eurytemora affinis]
MATMIGLFSSIGEHIPIFRKDKIVEASAEGTINRFHFRGTSLLILVCCVMVTCTEWISGTGSILDCIHGGSIPDNVINMFCYIQGTFSVPIHYRDHDTQIGYDVSQTGVGPYNPEKDFIEVKQYYQWVPFVLFLQGILFYVPHIIFKSIEGSKVKTIMGSLNLFMLKTEARKGAEEELADYFIKTRGIHNNWALGLLFAHFLYLLNVVGQIFFTDMFLGYEFSTYGVNAASFLEDQPEDRIDPMSKVFPRVTKCTFHKYGSSGTLQTHDVQCILPINIINEKIYVFLWFWFMILTVLTFIDVIHHVGLLSLPSVRRMIIKRKLRTAPLFKVTGMDIDTKLILDNISYGDWKLFYHLIRNMDSITAIEWMQALTTKLRDEVEDQLHTSETLPLKSKILKE